MSRLLAGLKGGNITFDDLKTTRSEAEAVVGIVRDVMRRHTRAPASVTSRMRHGAAAFVINAAFPANQPVARKVRHTATREIERRGWRAVASSLGSLDARGNVRIAWTVKPG